MAVRPKVFFAEKQNKVLILNPTDQFLPEPIAWEMDPEFYKLKTLATKTSPSLEVDPAAYDYLPVKTHIRDEVAKVDSELASNKLQGKGDALRVVELMQKMLRSEFGEKVAMADYESDPKALGAFLNTSKTFVENASQLDLFSQHLQRIQHKYFGEFYSDKKISGKLKKLTETPELMENFATEVDVVIKMNQGKSSEEIFTALAKRFDFPSDPNLIKRADETLDLSKLVGYIRRGVDVHMASRFESLRSIIDPKDFGATPDKFTMIIHLTRDLTFQALAQQLSDKAAFEKDNSLVDSDWENPITPDFYNQPQRWDKEPVDVETDSMETTQFLAFRSNYQRSIDDLSREIGKRFNLQPSQVIQYAKARIAKKASVLQQEEDFKNTLKLAPGKLEAVNEKFKIQLNSEELAKINGLISSTDVWDRVETLYLLGNPLSFISKDFLRVYKVKLDSAEKIARFQSAFERAIQVRYVREGIDVKQLQIELQVKSNSGRTQTSPVIEYPYNFSAMTENKILVFDAVVGDFRQAGAGIIDYSSGKLRGTELPTPPFTIANPVSIAGKVFAVGHKWDGVLAFKINGVDVWMMDMINSEPSWELLKTTGPIPEAKFRDNDTYAIAVGNKIYFIIAEVNHYDISIFDTQTNTWEKPEIKGKSPVPLVSANLTYMKMHGEDKIVAMFGNITNDYNNHPQNHLAVFDIDTLTWEPIEPEIIGDIPIPRKDCGTAFFPEDEALFVVGGRTETIGFRDIYMLHVDREVL